MKLEFTSRAYLPFVLFTFYLFTGCTLSYNITDLDKKNSSNSSTDKTAPILNGSIIDGISYSSLTTTPNLLWPSISEAKNGLDYYELALGSSAGGEEVLSWTKIGSSTNHAHNGLTLTKGQTYYPKIRAVDANGNRSTAIFGDGWIATTLLSFLQPTYSLITGESITLNLTGGETPYSFNASESGYLNTSTGAYTAPLNIAPTTETLQGHDNVGQAATTQVKIRAFENKDIFRSALYQPAASNNPQSIAIDSSNNIYTAGSSNDASGMFRGILRKSTDGGSTWTVIDDYQLAPNKAASFSSIFINNPTNEIYVLAAAYDSSNTSHWIVRKSIDSGSTWTVIDDYVYAASSSSASAMTIDSLGNLYVAGQGGTKWIIRKSTDSGATWNTMSIFDYSGTGATSSPRSIKIDSSNNIYVLGYGFNSSIIASSLVSKSTDGGVTWTTVDIFQLFSGYNSIGVSLVLESSYIYCLGYGYDSNGKSTWYTRRSSDAGATWTTVDTFQLTANFNSVSNYIFVNSLSHIYTLGNGVDASSKTHWIIRKSTDHGSTWTTLEDYQMSAPVALGKNDARSMAADASGNLFVTGIGHAAAADFDHWLIKKSSDQGTTWSLVDDYSYYKKGGNNIFSLAYDTNNNILYSAGYEGANYSRWIVKKSLDQGNSWTTIDSFQLDTYRDAKAYKILLNNGNIFVVGNATDINYTGHWIVKKSSDNGTTWSIIDNWTIYANNVTAAKAMTIDSNGIMYVTGQAVDGSFNQHLITRKSSNNGVSWSNTDDFISGAIAVSNDIAVNSLNHIFVSGHHISGGQFWMIRKSTDGGATWSNIDNYQLVSTKSGSANKIYFSSNGDIYVTGSATDSANIKHAITKKSTDNGSTWAIIDNYQLTTTKDWSSVSLVIDISNNIYITQSGRDNTDISHWITRKSSDGGTTWKIIDNYSSIDTLKSHFPFTSINCFTKQICIGGSRSVDTNTINQGVTRILSAE